MSGQDSLFYDCENDALRSCIAAAGGFKTVAGLLWPSLKPGTAYSRLTACLDDSKHEKLTFAEIIRIGKLGREADCHALMQYLGAELAYECRAIGPKDELAAALETFDAKADDILRAIQAVQRAKVRAAS
jgi:hypothetical protein